MTYNLGGGRRDSNSQFEKAVRVVKSLSPDVLALQEVIAWLNENDQWYFSHQSFSEEYTAFFGRTISMREHFHSGKINFVRALYNGWQDWQFGNALISRWEFARLNDGERAGTAYNLPVFRPPVYLGSRDTDPRQAILARLKNPPISPLVLATHLTTLRGERNPENAIFPGTKEAAISMRCDQVNAILNLLQPAIENNDVIFLMGDLNALVGECCLDDLGKAGFTRLVPQKDIPTHIRMKQIVDHIFVFPADRLLEYRCWVVDTPLARQASDHLPVVADLTIR